MPRNTPIYIEVLKVRLQGVCTLCPQLETNPHYASHNSTIRRICFILHKICNFFPPPIVFHLKCVIIGL